MLRAWLEGDVGRLQEITPLASSRDDAAFQEQQLQTKDRIRRQNFGRIVKLSAPQDDGPEKSARTTGVDISTDSWTLHFTLEEAFYLQYVERCLRLAAQHDVDDSIDDDIDHWKPPDNIVSDGPSVSKDERGRGDGAVIASTMSDEEAWRYCCSRRPHFSTLFAAFRHFRSRGFTVCTGHKYGAHYVLYEGSPEEWHSRYCVHVMAAGGGDSWGHMMTMTRLMPAVTKSLLLCGVSYDRQGRSSAELDLDSLGALESATVKSLSMARSSQVDKKDVCHEFSRQKRVMKTKRRDGAQGHVSRSKKKGSAEKSPPL